MNRESRNAFVVIGAVLVGLLAIGFTFSGRPGDAIVGDAPAAAHGEGEETAAAESETPAAVEGTEGATATQGIAEEVDEVAPEDVAEVSEIAPGAEETQAGEPTPEALAEPGEDAPEAEGEAAATEETPAEGEEAAGEEAAPAEGEGEGETEVALAGDPEAGERVFRQCQACHQVGEGAENRVGPQLNGVVGRAIASIEGFTYSDSLQAVGQEGREWTPEELHGFLANPREYVPGTAMAYAGVRSEDDLDNLIAYLATFE